MKILTPQEYDSLTDNEKLIYNYKESILIDVMEKGYDVEINGNKSYSLPVDDGKVIAINIIDGELFANTDTGKHYSSEWSRDDAIRYFQLASDAKYYVVRDMNNNNLNVGDAVVFIHSYSRESKGLVQGVVSKIETGKTEGSCRVYLTDIKKCGEWITNILHPHCTSAPTIKYKLATSLMKL